MCHQFGHIWDECVAMRNSKEHSRSPRAEEWRQEHWAKPVAPIEEHHERQEGKALRLELPVQKQ